LGKGISAKAFQTIQGWERRENGRGKKILEVAREGSLSQDPSFPFSLIFSRRSRSRWIKKDEREEKLEEEEVATVSKFEMCQAGSLSHFFSMVSLHGVRA
jgi:hypothetical protein